MDMSVNQAKDTEEKKVSTKIHAYPQSTNYTVFVSPLMIYNESSQSATCNLLVTRLVKLNTVQQSRKAMTSTNKKEKHGFETWME